MVLSRTVLVGFVTIMGRAMAKMSGCFRQLETAASRTPYFLSLLRASREKYCWTVQRGHPSGGRHANGPSVRSVRPRLVQQKRIVVALTERLAKACIRMYKVVAEGYWLPWRPAGGVAALGAFSGSFEAGRREETTGLARLGRRGTDPRFTMDLENSGRRHQRRRKQAMALHALGRPAGRLVALLGREHGVHPGPSPPKIAWTAGLLRPLSEADRAVGRLAGEGGRLPNPHLLMRPFVRREAVLSSRIEGTQATLGELLAAEAGAAVDRSPDDLREVANYVVALEYGIERLTKLPLSLRLVRELHARLMHGVRGDAATPGEFRRTQNWIGRPGCTLANATYVPPPPDELIGRASAPGRSSSTTARCHRWSRSRWSTTSSRPSTRSWTATGASGDCSSRCSWWSAASCRRRCST